MYFLRTFPILFFSILVFDAAAQRKPLEEVSLASPHAASLGKFADVPVNYHTGIPQIGYPVYTVRVGSIELPIGLSYHASGIKVAELSSSVGAGWSLNAGGVITRTIQGVPDERNTSFALRNETTHLSNNGFHNYLMVPHTEAPPDVAVVADIAKFEQGFKDGEPDLFFFNFGRYSGKFFLNDDGTPTTIPEQDFKIEYVYNGSGSINSWIITAPDATRYHFGRTSVATDVDPVEITDFYDESNYFMSSDVISSWYLNKIESPDNLHVVNLTYASEEYKYYAIASYPVAGVPNRSSEYKLVQNRVRGVRLTSISFANSLITFEAGPIREDLTAYNSAMNSDNVNTTAVALGGVRILDSITNTCKRYAFSYGYFNDIASPAPGRFSVMTQLNSDRKRLRLESIQEMSCSGALALPPTTFEYYNEAVPRRLSFALDHWGFINGAAGNSQLIPTYTENTFTIYPGANRESAWPAMRAGTLARINHATGGNTSFDFGANTTWVEGQSFSWQERYLLSQMGSRAHDPTEFQITIGLNAYEFELSRQGPSGNDAVANVHNAAGQLQFSMQATSTGPSKEIRQLSPGIYTVTIYRSNVSVSTSGVQMRISEYVSSPYNREEIVGGLRIQTITHHDGFSALNKQINYSYNENGRTSGVLYSRPTYVQVVRNDMIAKYGTYTITQGGTNCFSNGCVVCNTSATFPYMVSPNSIRPMETSQGNHIGYNHVTVSEASNGYSVYRYYASNKWDRDFSEVSVKNVNSQLCNSQIPNYPALPPPYDAIRGELKQERHHAQAGSILREINYSYVYADNLHATPALITASFVNNGITVTWGDIQSSSQVPPPNNPSQGMFGMTSFYDLKTVRKTQQTIEEKDCDVTGICSIKTTEQYFASAFHNQLTQSITYVSNGDIFESRIKYAADFRFTTCDAYSQCFTQFNLDKDIQNSIHNLAMTSCGTNQYCRFWEWQKHIKRISELRQQYLSCRNAYKTNVESCRINVRNTAGAELRPIIDLQNQHNLTPIETTKWRNNLLVGATFNRFDYSQNPVSQVYLNKIQLIQPSSLALTYSASAVSGTTISKDSRYRDEASFVFNAGNLAQQLARDGVPTTYLWGYRGKYPVAKIIGATLQQVNAAVVLSQSILDKPLSDASLRDELNRLRLALPASMIYTYTYSSLTGMTSETDANGQTIFYEYDPIGRLQILRDNEGNIIKTIEYHHQNQ